MLGILTAPSVKNNNEHQGKLLVSEIIGRIMCDLENETARVEDAAS